MDRPIIKPLQARLRKQKEIPSKSTDVTPSKSTDETRSKSTNVGQAIHRGISEMYYQDVCTDFEIIVGHKTFRCHKVVLAAVSDYFQKMFTSGMVETVKNQTTFDDINPKVFEIIITMLYPKDDEDPLAMTSEDEMAELLRVAEMLQMKILLEKCCLYFKATMSPTNCIERWKMAKSILNKDVIGMAWSFLLNHFQQVVSEHMIVSLELEDILAVIEDDHLVVDNEDTVWRAVYEWIMFDETNRKDFLVDLLQECCLTEVTEDTLFDEIAFDRLIRQSDQASQLVRETTQYRRHPALQSSMEVKLRHNMDKEQMLVLIGKKGLQKGPSKKWSLTPTQTIFRSFRQQKLITVRPLMNAKQGLAFCVHGTSMFVTSGKMLFEYMAASDRWEEREPVLVPLRGHTMSVTDGCLYAIGGHSGFSENSQVLRYSLQERTWTIEGELLVPVCDASSVCINNKIYVFGGKIYDTQLVDSVQEYDIKKHTSTILCHLPKPCRFSRALNRGDDAYIVTSDGDVIHFSSSSHKIELVASIPLFRRLDFGIDLRKGIINVYGGRKLNENGGGRKLKRNNGFRSGSESSDSDDEDGVTEDFTCTTVSVDIASGNIEESKILPFSMEVFGCASIVMSTKAICDRAA